MCLKWSRGGRWSRSHLKSVLLDRRRDLTRWVIRYIFAGAYGANCVDVPVLLAIRRSYGMIESCFGTVTDLLLFYIFRPVRSSTSKL